MAAVVGIDIMGVILELNLIIATSLPNKCKQSMYKLLI